jgi:hypothetical protein
MFNTFVNCKETFVIGLADEDADANVPPSNCTIANNLIRSQRRPVDVRSKLIDFVCDANVVETEAAMPEIEGFEQVNDLALKQDEHGLWRPTRRSPAIGAAAEIGNVETDIDGQHRRMPIDVGCDEVMDDVISYWPPNRGTVGPGWRAMSTK